MARPPLLGQAPRDRYRARDATGAPVDLGEAIFPIVTLQSNGIFQSIGTGFFIAENGIFVTAAHVIKAILDEHGKPTGPFGIFQFLPGGHFYVRQIDRTTHHAVADVAVGVAMPMQHKVTGAPMPNKVLRLALSPPPLGSAVCTYAYPRTTIKAGHPQVVHFEPGYFDGALVEHFPRGRDSVLQPGPCFRTSMVIHGGASGGPVVGPEGTVFAVNSSGLDHDTVSYVACVSEVLDLAIPGVRTPGDAVPRVTTVRELRNMGFVPAK